MQAPAPDAVLSPAQRAAADAGEKLRMPIAGRRFADFVFDGLRDAGITRVGVLLAPGQPVPTPDRPGLEVDAIVQDEPRGTAHAVAAAAAWAGDAPFLVLNGDNYYPPEAIRALAALDGPGLVAFDRDALVRTSHVAPERVSAFALVARDADGGLERIVEKPAADIVREWPAPVLVSMNIWKFDRRVAAACADVAVSPRGEQELPDAVMLARARGVRFAVLPWSGAVLDLSSRSDVAVVEAHLLAAMPQAPRP
jgi:glucose-1-phosphate thymidylyltransferase